MMNDSNIKKRYEAREQAEDFIFSYAKNLDSGNFVAFSKLFHKDGILAVFGSRSTVGATAICNNLTNAVYFYDQNDKIIEVSCDDFKVPASVPDPASGCPSPADIPTPKTQHVNTNLMFDYDELEKGIFKSECYFNVIQTFNDFPDVSSGQCQPFFKVVNCPTIIGGGRYQDTFEYVHQQWRIKRRCVYLEHLGDLSRHLRPPPVPAVAAMEERATVEVPAKIPFMFF